jgi:hypothetical protein
MMGRVMEGDPTHFGPDTPISELQSAMAEKGITPEDLSKLSKDPGQFMEAWGEATSGADPGASLADVFGGGGDVTTVVQDVVKQAPDFSNLTVARRRRTISKIKSSTDRKNLMRLLSRSEQTPACPLMMHQMLLNC